MTDLPRPDDRPDPSPGSSAGRPPRVPRWVKIGAAAVAVVVVLVVIVKLTGLGGEHGPGRHTGTQGRSVLGAAVTESSTSSAADPTREGH